MLLALFALAVTNFSVLAQSNRITGKIVSNENETSLVGVTVKVKGSTTSAISGGDGTFTINAEPNATLVFSSVGYAPQEIAMNGRTTITIRLVSDAQNLQQVVVVGYGTVKRKDVTGSVASVTADQIEKTPVTTLDQAIQGRAPGVQITNNDGAPGGGVQVQILGITSFGSNDPLYVVDGYPLPGGINTLNPDEIASIDILKDASSTSIYGLRASNGVVIITTKRGKRGAAQVSVDAYTAIQGKPKEYSVLDGRTWGRLAFQHAALDGYTALANWADADTLHNVDWQNAAYQVGLTQSYNVSLRGGSDKVQSSFTGGYYNQKGIVDGSNFRRYNLSANLDYTPQAWLKSMTSFKFTRGDTRLSFGTGGQGAGQGIGYLSKLPPTLDGGNLNTTAIKAVVGGTTQYGFFNPNNQAVRNWGTGPIYNIETQDQKNYSNNFLGSTSLEVTLLPGLRVKTNVGIDINSYSGYYFTPTDTRALTQYGTGTQTTQNFYSQSQNNSFDWLWENTVAYTKTFGDHSIDFVGGVSAQSNTFSQIGGQGNGLVSNSLRDLGLLPALSNIYGNQVITTLESQFARINYGYKDKYLLTGTVRRDGSSRFASGRQYGVFPSGAFAWRAKQESFLQDVSAISDLKIRASYGEVGNQGNAGNFQYLQLYTSGPAQNNSGNFGYPFNKVYQPGLVLTSLPNPGLEWEIEKQTDVGADLAFLDNSLTFTVDYYKKISSRFLLNVQVPAQTGFTSAFQNVGEIDNHGFEFAVNYSKTTPSSFHYNIGFNITTVSNTLTSLTNLQKSQPNLESLGFSTTGSNNWSHFSNTTVGGPLGEFYGYKSAGIFQTQKEIDDLNAISQAKYGVNYEVTTGPLKSATPGDRKYVDINHDGRITADSDQVALGSPVPKFFGGVTFDASYKNWDFSLFFYGTYGNKIFNYEQSTLESFSTSTGSVGLENIGRDYYNNAWTPTNGSTRYAKIDGNGFNANTRPTDIYVENGSYVKLRNLTIGYTLPMKMMTGTSPIKIRIYATAQNLFTITKYSGADPEIGVPQGTDPNNNNAQIRSVTASGVDVGTYPSSKFYTFGLNVTF